MNQINDHGLFPFPREDLYFDKALRGSDESPPLRIHSPPS